MGPGKAPAYTRAQSTAWLSWLAKGMLANGRTVFLVEELQPSWLRSEQEQLRYTSLSRVAVTVAWAYAYFLAAGLAGLTFVFLAGDLGLPAFDFVLLFVILHLISVLTAGIVGIPVGLLVAAVARRRFRHPDGPLFNGRKIASVAGCALLIAVGISAILLEAALVLLLLLFALLMSFALFATVGFWTLPWIGRGPRGPGEDIELAESRTWSWPRFRRVARDTLRGKWLVVCLVLAIPTYFLTLIVIPLCRGFVAALEASAVESKSRPNQGIHLTLRTSGMSILRLILGGAVIGGGVWGVLIALRLVIFWGEPVSNSLLPLLFLVIAGAVVGGVIGPFFAMKLGGVDVICHYVLRVMLWRKGYAPWRYGVFLDYACKELGFLQRVGGGYLFIHRYLLEHFAAMEVAEAEAPIPSWVPLKLQLQ